MKKILTSIQYLISVILLVGIFYYISDNRELLLKKDPQDIIAIIVLHLVFYGIVSMPLYICVKEYGIRIKFKKMVELGYFSNLLNILLPAKGGSVLRGSILKNGYGLKLRKYGAISAVLSLSGLLTIGIFNLFVSYLNLGTKEGSILLVSGITLSGISLLAFIFPKKLKKLKLNRIKINRFDIIKKVLVIYSVSMAVYIFRLHFILESFDIYLSISDLFVLAAVNLSVGIISILPGNLGLKEAGIVGVLVYLGIPSETAIAVALIDRVGQICALGFGSLVYFMNRRPVRTDLLPHSRALKA